SRARSCWPRPTARCSRWSTGTGWWTRSGWTRRSSISSPGTGWSGRSIWPRGWTSTGRRCERPEMTVSPAEGIFGADDGTEDALELVLALHRLVHSVRRNTTTSGLHPTQLLVLAQLIEAGPLRIGEL